MTRSLATRVGMPAALGLALTAAAAVTVEAAPVVYNFTFTEVVSATDSPGSFSGTLTTDGGFVTAITGSGTAIGTITALLPPGSYPTFAPNNNVFLGTAPYIDFNGISFTTSLQGPVNLYEDGGTYFTANDLSGGGAGSLTLEVVPPREPVPEPFSLALFGMGLAGLGLVGRRAA